MSVPDEGASADQAQPRAPQNPGFIELFLMFSQLGLSSFGGGLPAWMHRAFVQQRRWLGETEFYAALALARFMPGVSAVNLAVLIGQRLGGFSGATAAAIGLLVGPSLAVIGLAILYRQFGGTIIIDRVLEGAAMSTVGLLIGMGAKVGSRIVLAGIRSTSRTAGSMGAIVFLVTIFIVVGVLRFPTAATVFCLAPFSVVLSFLTIKESTIEQCNDGG